MLFMDLAIEIRRAISDRNDKMEKMKKKTLLWKQRTNIEEESRRKSKKP